MHSLFSQNNHSKTVNSYLLRRPVTEKENTIFGKFVAGPNVLFISFGMFFTFSKSIIEVNFSIHYRRYVIKRHYKKRKKICKAECLEK